MKRIFAVILAVTALFTVACGMSGSRKKQITLPLTLVANISGTEGRFNLRLTDEECVIDFQQEHPLYGTELRFDDDGGTATVGDFSRSVDMDLFPAQKALITALRGICQEDISAVTSEGHARYTIDKMTIIVYYDEDNTTIIGLETEEGGRRFRFDIALSGSYEIQSDGAG